MTQPLNYSAKAREQLEGYAHTATPFSALGLGYLAAKLAQAEIFVLPDHGELLDRGKVRQEMPNVILRPPFPVVALEYQATPGAGRDTPGYDEARCSRRIALAWEWANDLPPALRRMMPSVLGDGIAIASICYFDQRQAWLPIAAAVHVEYDAPWFTPPQRGAFAQASVAAGRMTAAQADAPRPPCRPVPILLEALAGIAAIHGQEQALELIAADVMDEANAYIDLCYALACRNVSAQRHPAPERLNRARAKAGKPIFPDHHTLILDAAGGAALPFGRQDRTGPRSHLRRGHIRRLSGDRVTWVNQTMVTGRGGFVSKQYDMRRTGGIHG